MYMSSGSTSRRSLLRRSYTAARWRALSYSLLNVPCLTACRTCPVLQPAERALCCSLLNVLAEHLNAEVVAGTIGSKQDAMDYITWTYFIRRLVRNPT